MRRTTIFTVVLASLLLPFGNAMAAGLDLAQSNTSMTGLLVLIQNASNDWGPRLHGYAVTVFWSLALIQFIWTFVPLVFKQADFSELIGELIRFLMIIGFFNILLDHSTEWAGTIIDSFRQAGAHAASLPTSELMPGDMFAMAVEFSRSILSGISIFNGSLNIVVALAALIVLLSFSFIAAFVFVTLVEAYVVINASVLFMAFGASQWTREYTLAVIRYTVSVGAKLFIVTLIVGLILSVAEKWQAAYTNDEASLMTLVGLSLICAYLTKTIPDLIAGMINGSSMGGGSSLGGMAAAGAAGAAAAVATIATAGAAAPAAAGALGAAGSGASAASAASGSGGLAASINSSFAGGSSAAGAGGGAVSTGAGSAGVGSGTGGSSAAKSAGAKVGGSASGGPSGSGPVPQSSQGVKQAAKQAGKAAQRNVDDPKGEAAATPQGVPGGGRSQSTPQASQQRTDDAQEGRSGISGHQVANALTRGAGILSAISVPGMEGAASMGGGFGGDQSQVDSGSGSGSDNSIEASETSDIIRPAQEPAALPTQSQNDTNKPELP
ncbi:P-type conjugative transfer protein TrbL [Pseudomonas simiae]|uniref:P-type conjugative transfer protein TrbL n=1 Tax=Pseudomonas simiae TaxID=321846 RepID=A0ABS9G1R1_9PSED|nr:P-type conjugative transfer protein TrbL [Pseudomonas simiae]MCF5189264.1 P-type conjugative transfer protein TrbL [Pseudomonas simiae]MCF5288096.1 P-type conjugative transfer protein TrbL [Pseudomonas simiae]MCF5317491.1 P-type conjugative transfer protein TrbL [Pseudomonas simiae]MCF5334894.1 P-type conjugative transfer protein TrbL [Pseudomonas simiae]